MQHSWLLSPCPSRSSLGGGTELEAQPVLEKLTALGTLFLHPVCFTAAPNTWDLCALLVTGWVSVCFCTLWSEAAAPSVSETKVAFDILTTSLLEFTAHSAQSSDGDVWCQSLRQWPRTHHTCLTMALTVNWIIFFLGGGRKVEPCEGPPL